MNENLEGYMEKAGLYLYLRYNHFLQAHFLVFSTGLFTINMRALGQSHFRRESSHFLSKKKEKEKRERRNNMAKGNSKSLNLILVLSLLILVSMAESRFLFGKSHIITA